MASGAHRAVRGAYVGTGALIEVKTIGFRPKAVKLYSVAGDEAYWCEDMADAAMYKRVSGGTGSFVTSAGITPLAEGFSIGAAADVNVSGEKVHYEVWG